MRKNTAFMALALLSVLAPTGVLEATRSQGIGKALLFRALEALREEGYAYAIIGGVGPREFYEQACGAMEITGSDPSIYDDLLP